MVSSRVLTFAVVAASSLWLSASSVMAQDEAIARRQKLMKGFSATAKEVKAAVEGKDYATVATKMKDIANGMDMANFAKNWPHNSTDASSKAKPEIWKNWNEFMLISWDGQQKALALIDAANSKNDVKVAEAYKAFGPVCGNCHKPYRAEATK